MRAKTILTLLFLFSLGLVAMLFFRALPENPTAAASVPPQPPKDEVLVAAAPLTAGTLLRAQDVVWQVRDGEAQSGEIVRPAAAQRATKPEIEEEARAVVYGAALRMARAAGEKLLLPSIVKPGDRDFLPTVLAQGARAISIPIATTGGTDLMFPGDHVDVILTQNFKTENAPLTQRSASETVVENLRILAIDGGKAVAQGATRTVTLEVLPQQAEKINVATELGKLSLTLRSLGDAGAAGAAPSKPTWAGDVSPALRAAAAPPPPAPKIVPTEKPTIKVMRGNQTQDVKPE